MTQNESISQRFVLLWFAISNDDLLRQILEGKRWKEVAVDPDAFDDIVELIRQDDAFPLAMWVMRRLVKSFCTQPPCLFKPDCFTPVVQSVADGCVEIDQSVQGE